MRIITRTEFRENQKSYFDLAEKERIIIHRGNNRKPVLLTPIEKSEETDIYFTDPAVMASIRQGIEDVKNGKVTTIKDLKNIWADIL
ncbi:MAG: prevent-host-death protein [Paludibacter sp.]|nr:prevent-host-death protein [Paludibacter sp.]